MTDFILRADTQSDLLTTMQQAGLLIAAEDTWRAAPGVSISYLSGETGAREVLVRLDGVANEAEIMAAVAGKLDHTVPPLRVWAGSEPGPVTVDQIKAERDRRTTHGGFRVGEYWFHSDLFSRSQHLGMAMMGAALPAGIRWTTMGGGEVTMTPTLAAQVFAAAAASDMAIFAVAKAAIAAITADPGAIKAVADIAWPKVFGE